MTTRKSTASTIPADCPPCERIEGVKIATLARKYGTPLYVYSHAALVENFGRIQRAFASIDPLIAYSVKCNSSAAVIRTLVAEGAGLDIVSLGELERGLAAGVDPAKIVFAGVGKSRREIEAALEAGIGLFNIESEPEAEAIAAAGRRLRVSAPAALRINPDVDASTHRYISTGRKENKFGIPFHVARRVFRRVARLRGINLRGLHAHIGSQIMKPDAFVKSLGRLTELIEFLRRDGHTIDTLNLGGGFGIDYEHGVKPMDMDALGRALIPLIEPLGVRLILEPGRPIAGPAGFFITRVEYIKLGDVKNFAIVDGAMNDLLRPALYSAYHRIALSEPRGGRRKQYDIVGPICESADFLGKERRLPVLKSGDLLVVHDAGAYAMAMASNYNSRPRPAEVMVKGRRHFEIRRRETLSDVVRGEVLPDFLR